MSDWQDRIVGERMRVDDEFQHRVEASSFSNQQWGLVMTAVEFDIEHPEDPERARLVADTSNLTHVMDELDNVEAGMAAMAGGQQRDDDSGGILGDVKRMLGIGDSGDSGSDEERASEAAALAQEYADALQEKLEENGRWDEIREAAV
ncbi:DUF5799 family protein [Salarchaeum sp. JOR-1]|uniref:DUF5799 family protein n=1 Tax=Salarchaeum sp. JOR-1 TaxID=2599399 RepID=UPI0011985368|nr:DUF5799 family protein [Salarchaeum sp. JOR-1]QDX41010.1 hypothetical protein FQU85_08905 [Salarchaeum sp. JOR-1]